MTDIFVDPDAEFKIQLYVSKTKEKIVADTSKEALKETYEDIIDIDEYTVTFRYPTFQDNTVISNAAMSLVDGKLTINPTSMRLKRMQSLIKSWTFKDKDGKVTTPNDSLVSQLHPSIANVLSMALEQKMEQLGL